MRGTSTSARSGRNLGEILIEQRMLTPQQLEYALGLQRSKYGLLGEILVDLGFVSEDDVIDGLALQLPGFAAQADASAPREMTLREVAIPPDVVGCVSRQLLIKCRAMPLRLRAEEKELLVAMVDSGDIAAIDQLRFATNFKIVPVAATRDDVEFLWRRYLEKDGSGPLSERMDLTGEFRAVTSGSAGEQSIVQLIEAIITRGVALGASDIHFDTFGDTATVRLRIDGVLYKVLSLPATVYRSVLSRLKVIGSMDISEKRVAQEGHTAVRLGDRSLDVRISILPVHNGERAALRIMERAGTSFDIEKLGLRPDDLLRFRRQLDRPHGLILVTGPTGSGKTTTLYAMLSYLNDLSRNIVTIEDPVEFSFPGFGQVQVDDRSGFTVAAVLRAVLRHDPNVIMVGEIRDEDTAQTSVRASLTGHLVVATVHTNDAPTAVARLADMGVPPFLLASSLNMAVAQRLVRRICTHCRAETEPDVRDLLRLGVKPRQLEGLQLFTGRGCKHCNFTGYKGRHALFEVLTVSTRMRELIAKGASVVDLRRQARRDKVPSLAYDGLAKAQQGLTTASEIMRQTYFEGV